ncbi:hypothetical protein [Gelidibacter maritimus]|uniref:Uncharacterized protein n=1 Tax=Gelidibacter maritimus TaxID=2761487 RepID=A0A7W2R4I7_9FLAO|nr:hypothetical protein [Gelidibacter maritimus]MBA6153941.1 hypothetical protein [Gelidibacter maritimus]
MGAQVKVKCQCGLRAEILTGGNMANHLTVDFFPCYCGHCREVVQANLKDTSPKCPTCKSDEIIPYTNPKLRAKTWKNTFIKYFKDDLTKGYYKCPKCQRMTLQFFHGSIFWD